APAKVRMQADALLEKMAGRGWEVTAGPHKTTLPGVHADRTRHITLEVAGDPHAYHLRLDNNGFIWEIRTVVATKEGKKAANVIPGSPRPWQGPGAAGKP